MEVVTALAIPNGPPVADASERPFTARARLPAKGKTKLSRRKLKKIKESLEDDEESDSEFIDDDDDESSECEYEEEEEWVRKVNEAPSVQEAMRALHKADAYVFYTKGSEIMKMIQLRFNDFRPSGLW